ncbi:MAG: hypothetical protein PHE55_16305 [Methylococcaceae bacterium]|nr:hypothetical protein [Methylococcaceae bacterium]
MKISGLVSILDDRYGKPPLRRTYWSTSAFAKEAMTLLLHPDGSLRRHVMDDLRRYLLGQAPMPGRTEECVRAAAGWLLKAQAATPDDGVSLGYFLCDEINQRWRASYPETTGYIMTSLFRFARRYEGSAAREAAIKMGHWEIAVQMPSGAVQGGPVASPDKQTPAAFNTGMVLDGWCSAYDETHDPAFLEAARKAADFLVADLDDAGYFKTNGDYVSPGEIKTYTCLCAWAIYRFGQLVNEARYLDAAIRSIEAALKQQQSNGWFAHSCLSQSDRPLTHTLGYTLQGILEVGLLAGREDFVTAVRHGVDPILERIKPNGYLPGRFYSDWEPATFSSCLTGSAQIAIVCFRLAEHTGSDAYIASANRLVDFLKSLQLKESDDPALIGALAGSFPMLGSYMRSGYPNWATKFFLDALMLQHDAETVAVS